jgi:aspartyl aminopeptidase
MFMSIQEDQKNDPHFKVIKNLLNFIDNSPTPFHAVEESKNRLIHKGFKELSESESWNISLGGRYFTTRNGSSIVAFKIGGRAPQDSGFKIIGAHTDSPNLKLKPNSVYEKSGYLQLGVEVYGGVLLSTWTDRDLSLAGRVILKGSNDCLVTKLVKIDRPLLRVPQLAIHLNRQVNEKGLLLNKQTHMPPVFALIDEKLQGDSPLKKLISLELDVSYEDIIEMELSLFDLQKGALSGLNNEFVQTARLDNLASCHAALMALEDGSTIDEATQVIVFYDNEEIGSESRQGAGSPFLKDVLERIQEKFEETREEYLRAISKSFFISADMAHAIHPNYSDMHDPRHMPQINKGPVVKINASQRYATDAETSAYFELLAKKVDVSLQKFVTRSDLGCGSTIGPITAANLGIKTIDIGNPMLSMHSIREMAGSKDHWDLIRVLLEYFK